jgi:hypothetical protein
MACLGRALGCAVLAVAGASLLGGCARSPSTLPPPVRQLTLEMVLAEPARPEYYYFFAIDADGDETDGPVPIVGGGPFWTGSWFNGWGLISNTDPPQAPSDYVLYHAGIFQQIHQGAFIGVPFETHVADGGRRLSATIDLDVVAPLDPLSQEPVPPALDISFITVDDIVPPQVGLRENYDALGEWPGVGFWWVGGFRIDVSQSTNNDSATTPEQADDVPGGIGALDITDWSVTVNLP